MTGTWAWIFVLGAWCLALMGVGVFGKGTWAEMLFGLSILGLVLVMLAALIYGSIIFLMSYGAWPFVPQ